MYLQFHLVKQPVRTTNFGFGFCSVLYGVGLGSVQVLAHFLLSGSGSVVGKTWVLVRFVLAGFGFLPSSNYKLSVTIQQWVWRLTAAVIICADDTAQRRRYCDHFVIMCVSVHCVGHVCVRVGRGVCVC